MQAVAAMVEECCKFVDQTPDQETKIKLIDTLRTVSEGKVQKCGLSRTFLVTTKSFSIKIVMPLSCNYSHLVLKP